MIYLFWLEALTVDGAKLNVQADMLAVNGVVHVIDRVLLS